MDRFFIRFLLRVFVNSFELASIFFGVSFCRYGSGVKRGFLVKFIGVLIRFRFFNFSCSAFCFELYAEGIRWRDSSYDCG